MNKKDIQLKPIKTKKEYQQALSYVDMLIDAKPGSKEEELLEHISILIAHYEDTHFIIDTPDPIEAIKYRMVQTNLSQKNIAKYLWWENRVSEVLNGKRPLTVKMMKNLYHYMWIPAEVLLKI